jgi:flagellar biogenesis protein FliO
MRRGRLLRIHGSVLISPVVCLCLTAAQSQGHEGQTPPTADSALTGDPEPQTVLEPIGSAANVPSTVRQAKEATAGAAKDAVPPCAEGAVPRPASTPRLARRAASEAAGSAKKASSAVREGRLAVVDLLGPLLVVLGIIAGATLLIRKLLPRTNRLGGGGVIDVVASHYLSGKQSLCLVKLGRRAVLIGVTPERIATVAKIDDPNELSEIVSAMEQRRPNSFTSTLARLCTRDAGQKPGAEAVEPLLGVSTEKLAEAESSVRDLLGRIRAFGGAKASAEPA